MYKIYIITMWRCNPGTQKSDPVPAQKMRTLDPDTAAHRLCEVDTYLCSRSLLSNLSTFSESP
jgi:hypothetical protein